MSKCRLLQVGRQRHFHWSLLVDVQAGHPRAPPNPTSGAKSGSGRHHNFLEHIFFRSGIRRRSPPAEKSTRTVNMGQLGATTSVPPGLEPGTKMLCSHIGSHTLSTTSSTKCNPYGTNSPHHVKVCHSGTIVVAMASSFCSLPHTRLNNRKVQLIHRDPIPQKKREGIHAHRPLAPV